MALEEVRVEDIMRDTLGTTNLNDLHSTKYEKGETKMEQLRVIMTLVFDSNPEKNIGDAFNYMNYGSEYFPQIKSFNKYWDITGSIDEVIGLNNALDYKNNNNSKGSTLFKIAYLVTDELYRSVTNDFYFDPRDLSEDISNGRFFDRDLHEELVKAFFNTPEYLHELDISGVMNSIVERNIAENTNHLKFVTDSNKRLLLGKDKESSKTPSDCIDYDDIEYMGTLVKKYEDSRNELKHFIFALGKKGLDNDVLQPLINAAGTLKEVNKYLKEADTQFKNLYNEKFSEAPNTRYITETKAIKNEKYEEGNGEPEFRTITTILPNPNYVEETDKGTEVAKTIQDEFIKKINEIGNDIAIRNALSPEQREIVSKKVEEFSNEAEGILKRMAEMTNKALANMEKFGKENKEDK